MDPWSSVDSWMNFLINFIYCGSVSMCDPMVLYEWTNSPCISWIFMLPWCLTNKRSSNVMDLLCRMMVVINLQTVTCAFILKADYLWWKCERMLYQQSHTILCKLHVNYESCRQKPKVWILWTHGVLRRVMWCSPVDFPGYSVKTTVCYIYHRLFLQMKV